MNRVIYIIVFLVSFACGKLSAETPFRLDFGIKQTKEVLVEKVFTANEIIYPFSSKLSILGASISGSIEKLSDNYLVRIILKDKIGNEYLILESYEMINSSSFIPLEGYCEESCLLDNVEPDAIMIVVNNAILNLNKIEYVDGLDHNLVKGTGQQSFKQRWTEIKSLQVKNIVQRVNSYNEDNCKLWVAGETSLSMLPWSEKKVVMGIKDANTYTWGIEYYINGILDVGFRINSKNQASNAKTQVSSMNYPISFDWRNVHAHNWMTPIRNQVTNGTCWAFTAVGVTEALANLYFNKKLDLDLAEQELISCSDDSIGTSSSGFSWKALQWIADNGISEETAFPFSNSDEPCSNKGPSYEHIQFHSVHPVLGYSQNDNDSVKKYLINKGPMTSGIRYWNYNSITGTYEEDYGHAMTLVGYNTMEVGDTIGLFDKDYIRNRYIIQEGDGYAGETYWIFKNSLINGYLNSHNGYAYVHFLDNDCFRQPYYAETPVTSINYNEGDVEVTDTDGDGYYFVGIGHTPNQIAEWLPQYPDADDGDSSIGKFLLDGSQEQLNPNTSQILSITGTISLDMQMACYKNIRILFGSTYTVCAPLNMLGNVSIYIKSGGNLIVDGGTITNANIIMEPNAKLLIKNGGIILMKSGTDFIAPTGSIVDIEHGAICSVKNVKNL